MDLDAIKQAAKELKRKITNTTPLQGLLQDATNSDNWQTDPKILQQIADATYSYSDYDTIIKYIWEKLMQQKTKNWKKVLKVLNLVDYLLKNGAPKCAIEFKDEIYRIRTLQDFTYYEDSQERGEGIRIKSKEIVDMLSDETKLDRAREQAKQLREKLANIQGCSSEGVKTAYSGFSSKDVQSNQNKNQTLEEKYKCYSGNSKESYDDYQFKGGLGKYLEKGKKAQNEKQPDGSKNEADPQKKAENKEQPNQQILKLPKPGEKAPGVSVSQQSAVASENLLDFDDAQKPNPKSVNIFEQQFGGNSNAQAKSAQQQQQTRPQSNLTDFDWKWEQAETKTNPPTQQTQPLQQNPPVQQYQQPQQKKPSVDLFDMFSQTNFSNPNVKQQNPVQNTQNNNLQPHVQQQPAQQKLQQPQSTYSNPIQQQYVQPQQPNKQQPQTQQVSMKQQQPVAQQSNDDGFTEFQKAETKPQDKLTQEFGDLINLKDMTKELKLEKPEPKSGQKPQPSPNQEKKNFLYTSKEELDNFEMYGSLNKNQPPYYNQQPTTFPNYNLGQQPQFQPNYPSNIYNVGPNQPNYSAFQQPMNMGLGHPSNLNMGPNNQLGRQMPPFNQFPNTQPFQQQPGNNFQFDFK